MASVTQTSLLRLIEKIKSNEIRIPIFQREYVWSPGQILDLLESIRTGIPLGAIVLWNVPNKYNDLFENYFKVAPQGGIKKIMTSDAWEIETIPYNRPVFSNNPNNFEGILDGRQRTESILMAIGGVTYGLASNKHARVYYLDLTMDFKGIDSPFGSVKTADIENGGRYSTLSSWIADGKFPLWFTNPTFFIGELPNPAHYSGPAPGDVSKRIQQLSLYLNSVSASSLAVIEIENTYDLSQVCSIFETLNISGTKVSAFDITCTNIIGNVVGTNKPLDLRDRLRDISNNELNEPGFILSYFNRWCEDKNKWTIISQAVTMMYILSDTKRAEYPSREPIDSLKGESLINTPEKFYRELFDYSDDGTNVIGLPSISRFEIYCKDFYKVTNGCSNIRTCPYPILFTQYLGLRYKVDTDISSITSAMVNDVFRVFYWRVSSTSRYDQGYLSQATTDAKNIWEFLIEADNSVIYNSDKQTWWNRLDAAFANWRQRLNSPTIDDINLDLESTNSGAKAKTFNAMLFVKKPKDLKTGNTLDTLSNTQLHHIFPKNWIKNNANTEENKKRLTYPTAIVPLSQPSNLEWLASAPDQKISEWHPNHNWQILSSHFESILIDQFSFIPLTDSNYGNAEERISEFFNRRKIVLRETLLLLCKCNNLPQDLIY
jgi:hypothetical protein